MRLRQLKTLLPKLTIAALFIYGLAYMYEDANADAPLSLNLITSHKLPIHKPRSHSDSESNKIEELVNSMVRRMQSLQQKKFQNSDEVEEIGDSEKNQILNELNQENDKERGREIFEEDLDDGTSWRPVNGYPKKTSKKTTNDPPEILDEIFAKIPGGKEAVDAGKPEAKRAFEEVLQEYNLKMYNNENDQNHKDTYSESDAKFKSLYAHYMLENQKRLGPLPDIRQVPTFFDPFTPRKEPEDVPFDQKLDYLKSRMRERVMWKMRNAVGDEREESPPWRLHQDEDHKDEQEEDQDSRVEAFDNLEMQRQHPELTKIISGDDPLVRQLLHYSEMSGTSLTQLGQYAAKNGLNLQQLVERLQQNSHQSLFGGGETWAERDLNFRAHKMFNLADPPSDNAVNEMNKRIYIGNSPNQGNNQDEEPFNAQQVFSPNAVDQNLMPEHFPDQPPFQNQFVGQNILQNIIQSQFGRGGGVQPGIYQGLMNQDQQVMNQNQAVMNQDQQVMNQNQAVMNQDQQVMNQDQQVMNQDQSNMDGETEDQQQPQDFPEQHLDPKLLETFYNLRDKIRNNNNDEIPQKRGEAQEHHPVVEQEKSDHPVDGAVALQQKHEVDHGEENMKISKKEEALRHVEDGKRDSNEIERVVRSTSKEEVKGEKVNQEVMAKQEVKVKEQEVVEKAIAYMSEQEFELLMEKQNTGTTQISRMEMDNIRVVVIEMYNEDEEATGIGNTKVLTVNEYKKWKPQQFVREIANPVLKSKEKPTLMPYTGDLLRPNPKKLIKDLTPRVKTAAIEKELTAERKRRIDLGDDDLENIPEVKEELLAAGKARKIPNFVHFIWFTCHKFRIHHYMSMRSALIYQRPKLILFHTDCKPNGTYWKAIVKEAGDRLRIVKRSPPEKIWGLKIEKVEHRSDVARLQILLEVGGIYMDDDIIILKSLDPLRNETMVLGEENYDALANSIIMSKRSSWFLTRWYQEYQTFNNSKWSHSSCFVPWSLWLIFPTTVRVVKEKMLRPNWEEIKFIYHELWDWSENYSIHLYSRFMPALDGTAERSLKELAVLNTTYGEIARYVIWGNKKPQDISQWT